MAIRRNRNSSVLPDDPRKVELQRLLVEAQDRLTEAELIADALGEDFDFHGRTYTPKKTIVSEGGWDLNQWESSNC